MNVKRFNRWLIHLANVCFVMQLSLACGKKSSSGGSPKNPDIESGLNPQPPKSTDPSLSDAPKTTREAIEALEISGSLPKLDRTPGLMGPDKDGNRVRDDIDAYIKSLNLPEKVAKSTVRLAAGLQQLIMVDVGNDLELRRVSSESHKSIVCLMRAFNPKGSEANIIKPQEILNKIEAITFNTRERAAAYMNYNKARSGSVSTAPSGDDCE